MLYLYQLISRRFETNQKKLKQLTQKIKTYPNGYLRCNHNGKYIQFYRVHKKKRTYIQKKDTQLVNDLIEKLYLECSKEDIEREQKAISAFLKSYNSTNSHLKKLMDKPQYAKLLSTAFKPLSEELANWAKEEYEHNPSHPENLKHFTSFGMSVRSKSEVYIAQALHSNRIPFRYECALKNRFTLYPDFTIRHPRTGETIIWEHFGMMDSSEYARKAFAKLQQYYELGFVPSINLIITFETSDHPLNIQTVESIVEEYFL